MKLIPFGRYCPDNLQQDNANTDRLHNVFIRQDGTLQCVNNTFLAAPQPEGDNIKSLFAAPTEGAAFKVFGGGDALYTWHQELDSWRKVYEPETKSRFRWNITDFNGKTFAARPGEALLIFDDIQDKFIPIAGAPRAGGIYSTKDFLIAFNIQDKPGMVAWSALKDGTKWDFGVENSGFELFTRGGAVTAVIGGENPYIFTLRQIYRMTRASGDAPWVFRLIDPNTGAYNVQDACEVNNLVFFCDTQSYFMLDSKTDELVDIGRDIVSRTWGYYDSDSRETQINMHACSDVMARRAYFVFPNKGTLIYNIKAGAWSTMADEGIDVFIGNFRVATYDVMDKLYKSICNVDVSPDEFTNSYSCSIAVSKNDGIYLFSANDYAQAEIGSGSFSTLPDYDQNSRTTPRANMQINSITAVCDNLEVNNRLDYRVRRGVAAKNKDVKQNRFGYSNYRINAVNARVYASVAGFDFFQGWAINQKQGVAQ